MAARKGKAGTNTPGASENGAAVVNHKVNRASGLHNFIVYEPFATMEPLSVSLLFFICFTYP